MFTRTGVEGLLGLLVKWVHNCSCWSRQRFTRSHCGVVYLDSWLRRYIITLDGVGKGSPELV